MRIRVEIGGREKELKARSNFNVLSIFAIETSSLHLRSKAKASKRPPKPKPKPNSLHSISVFTIFVNILHCIDVNVRVIIGEIMKW